MEFFLVAQLLTGQVANKAPDTFRPAPGNGTPTDTSRTTSSGTR